MLEHVVMTMLGGEREMIFHRPGWHQMAVVGGLPEVHVTLEGEGEDVG